MWEEIDYLYLYTIIGFKMSIFIHIPIDPGNRPSPPDPTWKLHLLIDLT